MGNCTAPLKEARLGDQGQWDGFQTEEAYISYYQVESVLLEYPKVVEAGVIAQSDSNQGQTLSVYLALEEDLENEEEYRRYIREVDEFVRRQFSLCCLISVKIREKLPMTRSGKILRTVLQEWNFN
jgi:acyl-coenzyme A synthetase/AMP-(fatty) acid ligase